ncbi:MAG TPA: FecR domain-containing protein [Burkholderiales bacterium]|nr:FecR domain-containing protein [Burkholderiales bacterium]
MRSTRLFFCCVAFCVAALALPARAETAGQVLTAVGNVLTLRGSQILRLSPGSTVESGDQIHTGSESKALIRFTDSGLIWIRPQSDFIVDEYSYGQTDRARAFFSLLRGGVRSLTGSIGHRDKARYRLRTSVATIGIRGTDFSVFLCQFDCRNSDGSVADKGLYGQVIEGRIAVAPLADRMFEREFGAGESFHLANESSYPTPLFLPPPFLRDKTDEQARFGTPGATVALTDSGATPGRAQVLPNLVGTGGSIVSSTGGLVGGLSNGLTGNLAGTLTNSLSMLSAVTSTVPRTVSRITQPALDLIGSPAVLSITVPVTSVVTSAVDTTLPAVTSAVTSTVDAALPAVTSAVTSTVSTTLPAVTSAVTSAANTTLPAVTSGVTSTVNTTLPAVTSVAAPVVTSIAPAVSSIALPAGTPIGTPIGATATHSISLPGTLPIGSPALPGSPLFKR